MTKNTFYQKCTALTQITTMLVGLGTSVLHTLTSVSARLHLYVTMAGFRNHTSFYK
jgi:hypothetical protein